MKVREAVLADAQEISGFLQELATLGKRSLPSDEAYVRAHYIAHADNIRCSVVEDVDGALLGLQILKRASQDNAYGVTPGWGIIGTHVQPSAGRRGVGRALFAATLEAARKAGLEKIDATIGASNPEGLGYYEAIGFRTYKTNESSVSKCLELAA
ncbi:Ribosomal protein S18 acetylase RimI [Pseudovibrio ascidiaceicola]|uniref:Ribosomal protein S18 acetylase RimI n=1 Tax=Pseudovibrio ascidiaceicola TaxID=285279 RepID=A0A1I4C0N8_9HYPH|nr:GNAT family N-acetyltransferase [Pseudovibrio ascidiaceicola]SFK73977.1 Ribosomal protein S18 acetylase RimI [Pseudovibrio ascidiaceicola]